MAAALTLDDRDITEALKRVYSNYRVSAFPRLTWPDPKKSYAYYGFWRCPLCDFHLEGYQRTAHETVHALRGEASTRDAYTVTISAHWNVGVISGISSGK